jgi:hypothetical protein
MKKMQIKDLNLENTKHKFMLFILGAYFHKMYLQVKWLLGSVD